MNGKVSGKSLAFCVDRTAPEINISKATPDKGIIPNGLYCGRNIDDFSVASGESVCHNGDHLFAVDISRYVIYAIGGLTGNPGNHNIAAAVGILSVIIVPFPGGTIGICHSG